MHCVQRVTPVTNSSAELNFRHDFCCWRNTTDLVQCARRDSSWTVGATGSIPTFHFRYNRIPDVSEEPAASLMRIAGRDTETWGCLFLACVLGGFRRFGETSTETTYYVLVKYYTISW